MNLDRLRSPLTRGLAAATLGIVGGTVALLLVPLPQVDAGPVDVTVAFRPSLSSGTVLDVGALGTVVLDTHDVPLEIAASARSLDPATTDALLVRRPSLVPRVDEDAVRAGVLRNAAIAAVVAAGAGAAAAGVVLRRRSAAVLGGAVGGGAFVVLALATALTYDQTAVDEPQLEGSLAYVPQAVQVVGEFVERNDQYSERLGDVGSQLAFFHQSLLLAAEARQPATQSEGDDPRFLVIADLHLNRAGFALARSLAQAYDVDGVINLGDDTDWGSGQESEFLSGVADFGVPYLWVRGNHDSRATQSAVEAAGGLVLDDEVVEVAGVRFYGIGDPTFTPVKSREVLDAGEQQFKRTWSEDVFVESYAAAAAREPVDVVLIHDETAASALPEALAEEDESDWPALVLSGHRHRFALGELGEVRSIQMGSTGGAGLRVFDSGDETPLQAGILTIDTSARDRPTPTNLDLFTLRPLSESRFSVERIPLAEEAEPVRGQTE